MAEAVAPVSLTASLTEAKTGLPKWVSPAFFGLVPPTTFVPVPIDVNQYYFEGQLELVTAYVNSTNHNRSLAVRENCNSLSKALFNRVLYILYSRSLLPSKTLIDDLGVLINAQILHRRCITRRWGRITSTSDTVPKDISCTTSESLHHFTCQFSLNWGRIGEWRWCSRTEA